MPDHVHETTVTPDAEDILQLLEEEMKSCVLPQIKDTSKAATEDLVKDMHRVLTGNGGVTHGMIYKVAAANVHTRLMNSRTKSLEGRLNAQLEFCQSVQEAADKRVILDQADRIDARKVKTVLWTNRYLIIAILAVAIVTAFNVIRDNPGVSMIQTTPATIKEIRRLEETVSELIKLRELDTDKTNNATNMVETRGRLFKTRPVEN